MELMRSTDLGLRILMRVAVEGPEGSLSTTQSVATEMAVSYAHAAKVVARLQKLGVVETRRGRHGGLGITEHGRTVSIGRLVRELEGAGEVIDCDGGVSPCPLRAACRLRSVLRDARDAFFSALDPYTVADLTPPATATVLLSLAGRPPD